jgi:multisubunit Na+/H+ antiporter MnhE subunit
MLHAAAMLTGLFSLWLLLVQRWGAPMDFALAGAAAVACLVFASRLGGLGRNGPFARAPQMLSLVVSRADAVTRGAMATVRASIAADVTLRPALARVKWRVSSDSARAAFAGMVSAAPGAVVVETDPDGMLVHVINEDAVDASEFSRLEARVAKAVDGTVLR